MTTTTDRSVAPERTAEPKVAAAHQAWRLLLCLYGLALLVTVFLAGSGVFRASQDVSRSPALDAHRSFGVVLDVLALLVLVAAVVARHSRRAVVMSGVLLVLNFLQGIWVKLADDARALGGLHTVGAIAIAAVLAVLMRLAFSNAEVRLR